jgi:hypothetical protein
MAINRLLILAVSLSVMSAAAAAQRGGGHAGFSGHAAAAPRSFASSARLPFGGAAPRYAYRGTPAAGARYGNRAAFGNRPAFYSRRAGHPVIFWNGYGPGYGLLSDSYLGDYLDYPDGFDADASDPNAAPADYAAAPYGAPPPDGYYGAPYPYAGEPSPPVAPPEEQAAPQQHAPQQRSAPVAAPQQEDAVTIIFNDGRAPETIHNYALTRTDLYVVGGRIRDIPLAQIDLAATEKANRDNGVDFHLPTLR